jgi:hypothetical protein
VEKVEARQEEAARRRLAERRAKVASAWEDPAVDVHEAQARAFAAVAEATLEQNGAEDDHESACEWIQDLRADVTRARHGRSRTPSAEGAAELRAAEEAERRASLRLRTARERTRRAQEELDDLMDPSRVTW